MRKSAALGALLFSALSGISTNSGAAAGTTTVYDLANGKLLGAEQDCTQIVLVFNFLDCTYGSDRGTGLLGWTGPPSNGGFYAVGGPAQIISYVNGTPDPNQIDVPVTGTVTIDDNGTPGDPTDDLISADWHIGAAVRNVLTGNGDSAFEGWTEAREQMAPIAVNATLTAANGAGGVDYYISGQAPFPTRLHHTKDTVNFGAGDVDTDYPSSHSPGVLGGVYWDTTPGGISTSPTGIERDAVMGGNAGGTTSLTLTGYFCGDNPGDNDCTTSPLLWGAPQAVGSTVADHNAGWDNVLLKLSTDASGAITSAFLYYTREFRINAGSNPGPVGSNNSWQGGAMTFNGQARPPAGAGANPDSYKVRHSASKDLAVTSNDNGTSGTITGSYTLAIVSAPSCGTATLNPLDGSGSITFLAQAGAGSCTFDYSLTATGIGTTQATVTMTVLADPSVTTPVTLTGDTKGKAPTAVSLPQDLKAALVSAQNLLTPSPTVTVSTPPANGTAAVAGTTITYTAGAAFFQGADAVGYTITDSDGQTAIGTLTINIPNVQPTAGSASYSLSQGENKAVDVLTVSGSAAGNGAPANHTFAVKTAPSAGTAAFAGSTLTYTATATTAPGDYTVVYTITDGDGEVSADGTLTFTVSSVTVNGGGGPFLPGGGGALDPVTLGFLALGVPVVIRRRQRRGSGFSRDTRRA